jgi:GH15 family glucan-1,4-alpha-glucosidase
MPRSSTRRQEGTLGDFPQAFSHLALIEAAARMIVPELLAYF